MTISNEPERHEQLTRLLDEQRAAAEQDAPSAAAALEAFGGFTLTASGARRLAGATGETLVQVEQAARRQGMNVEPQTEIPRAEVDYAAGDRTLFPADPSTEHMLPDLADDDMSRVVVRIGAVALTGEWQRVLDKRSGLWVEVRRAHCDAECECGGEVRLTEQPSDDPDDGCRLCGGLPGDRSSHWPGCSRGAEQPQASSWGGPATTIDVPDDDEAIARMLLDRDPAYGSEVYAAMCRRWGKGEADARWHNILSASDRLAGDDETLDATMRDQMAQWPDDTLALITVGELRSVLRKAHDHGSGFDEVEDCAAFLDQLVGNLPVSDEERAEHGLPNVGRRESFERPGSAYDRVLGHGQGLTGDDWRGVVAGDPWLSTQTAEHGAVTPSGRFEVVGPDSVGNVDVYDLRQDESPGPWLILPEGERRELVDALAVTLPVDPDVAAIVEQLRYAVDNGVGVSLDAGHAAALTRHLGRQR